MVWRSARSASRTRSLAAGWAASSSAPSREGRRDDRRERLDVGAHDEHVARLERRVVGEQADDDLAQHLDLAGAAVAGVHLHAAVAVGERRRVGRDAVVGEVVLEPAEQGVGRCGAIVQDGLRAGCAAGDELLQLEDVAGQAASAAGW